MRSVLKSFPVCRRTRALTICSIALSIGPFFTSGCATGAVRPGNGRGLAPSRKPAALRMSAGHKVSASSVRCGARPQYPSIQGSIEIPLSPQPSGGFCVTGATPRKFRSIEPNFDSTTAGVYVTVKHGLREGRTRCEARSPRHAGPRSFWAGVQSLGSMPLSFCSPAAISASSSSSRRMALLTSIDQV